MNSNIRHNVLKIPLSDAEDLALRRKCSAMGMQRSPIVRQLINRLTGVHIIRRQPRRERPSHGHVARCPNRVTFGGGAIPMRV